MEASRNYLVILLMTFILDVLITYTYSLHPFHALIIALLISILSEEDYRTKYIDMRVAACLAVVIVLGNPKYIFHFASAYAIIKAFLWGTCKFVKKDEATVSNCDSKEDSYSSDIPFIPIISVSLISILTFNMLYNPLGYIKTFYSSSLVLTRILETHLFLEYLNEYLFANKLILLLVATVCISLAIFFYYRLLKKEKEGYEALYSFGEGDPIVLASIFTLVGGEVFIYAVLILSLIIGESCRLFNYVTYKLRHGGCI